MHLYVIEYDRRNELMEYLRSHQLGTILHFPLRVHQYTTCKNRIRGWDNPPNTGQFYKTNLTLLIYPESFNDAGEHINTMGQKWFRE